MKTDTEQCHSSKVPLQQEQSSENCDAKVEENEEEPILALEVGLEPEITIKVEHEEQWDYDEAFAEDLVLAENQQESFEQQFLFVKIESEEKSLSEKFAQGLCTEVDKEQQLRDGNIPTVSAIGKKNIKIYKTDQNPESDVYSSRFWSITDCRQGLIFDPLLCQQWKDDMQQASKVASEDVCKEEEAEIFRSNVSESYGKSLHGKKHEEVDPEARPFVCNVCNRAFAQKAHLVRHQQALHSTARPFICNICDKSFTTKDSFGKHQTVHLGLKPFICDICVKCFSKKTNLERHQSVHSGIRPFSCEMCTRAFTDKSTLSRHQQVVHKGIRPSKPFVCDICEKTFSGKGSLQRHQILHSGIKLFSCDICTKSFIDKLHLSRHLAAHAGIRPYTCVTCKKSFTQKSHLKGHQVVHTGVRSFVCETCNKAFTTARVLQRHQLVHSLVKYKPYSCDLCYKTFSEKRGLVKHQTKHNN